MYPGSKHVRSNESVTSARTGSELHCGMHVFRTVRPSSIAAANQYETGRYDAMLDFAHDQQLLRLLDVTGPTSLSHFTSF